MSELIVIIIGVILAIFGILVKDNKKKSKIIDEQKKVIKHEQTIIQMHEAQAQIAQVAQAEIKEVDKMENVQIEEIKQANDQEAIDIGNTIVNNFNKRNASKLQNP